MTKNIIRLIISLIFFIYLCQDNLLGHDGHKKKPKMPAIGMVQGTVTDSSTGTPIEYASISMVDNHDGSVVTGGLSKKNGSFNISEIPLGQYIVMVEFIGYAKKEIGPLNIFPGEDGSIEHFIGEVALKISSVNLDAVEDHQKKHGDRHPERDVEVGGRDDFHVLDAQPRGDAWNPVYRHQVHGVH